MNIVIQYDSSANSAPAAFKQVVQAVVNFFDTTFTSNITVNIGVGWGTIDGQNLSPSALGESETYIANVSYAQLVGAMKNEVGQSTNQKQAYATLPASSPVKGGSFVIATAEAKALGISVGASPVDGYVGFADNVSWNFDATQSAVTGEYDLYGTIAHEISEVMGRFAGLSKNGYTPMDLFRYWASGVRDFTASSSRYSTPYFSIDSGKTPLADWNTVRGADPGDWATANGLGHTDSFDAFGGTGTEDLVSSTDVELMNVLGYTVGSTVAGASIAGTQTFSNFNSGNALGSFVGGHGNGGESSGGASSFLSENSTPYLYGGNSFSGISDPHGTVLHW